MERTRMQLKNKNNKHGKVKKKDVLKFHTFSFQTWNMGFLA
jgi:hypothetical protein